MTSNNANEGIPLSPPTTNTLSTFRSYINITFPNFSVADKQALEAEYSYDGDDQDTNPSAPLYDTSGTSYPTSVNQSGFATGQQQRVFDVFAEYAFDCPSYWVASAFPQAWKYQFSVPPAYHGYDLNALWSTGASTPSRDFIHAFQKIWGSFVASDNPVISIADAMGSKDNATVPIGDGGLIDWPQWDDVNPQLLNLNTTGGTPYQLNPAPVLKYYIYMEPGVTNAFKTVDAKEWEGGRGERCEWWQSVAERVPY